MTKKIIRAQNHRSSHWTAQFPWISSASCDNLPLGNQCAQKTWFPLEALMDSIQSYHPVQLIDSLPNGRNYLKLSVLRNGGDSKECELSVCLKLSKLLLSENCTWAGRNETCSLNSPATGYILSPNLPFSLPQGSFCSWSFIHVVSYMFWSLFHNFNCIVKWISLRRAHVFLNWYVKGLQLSFPFFPSDMGFMVIHGTWHLGYFITNEYHLPEQAILCSERTEWSSLKNHYNYFLKCIKYLLCAMEFSAVLHVLIHLILTMTLQGKC